MSRGRLFALMAVAIGVAVAALVGAALLDADWLRLVALAAFAVLVVAAEVEKWRGSRRGWLLMVASLAAVVAIAFLLQKASG